MEVEQSITSKHLGT